MPARNLRVYFLLAVLLLPCALAWGSSPDPTMVFAHALRMLSQPPLAAQALASAQQDPAAYRGQVFEVSATVDGLVSADGDRTALLSVNTLSVTAKLPSSLKDAFWFNSGQTVRVLLCVSPEGTDTSPADLRVLAAAPESDVAVWERRQAAMPSPRTPSPPSRSLSYSRSRSYAPTPGATLPPGAGPIAPLSPRALAIYAPYRNAIRGMNRHLSEHDVDKITTSVLYFSDHYDLDPRLVVAMIIAESDFDVYSTSNTGAMGLGQLMPETARGLGVTNAYDPIQNIAASVHILRGNLDKYGGAPANAGVIPFDRIALTMAAYNAGPGAVRKYHGVPPYRETQRYVAKVTALYKKMCGLG
jgi:soluble lytic murein transglycosylase-like protein